jgi:hypothetical protein
VCAECVGGSAAQRGGAREDVLARALGGAEAGLVDQLSGLVLLVGLLDEELDAAVLAGDDADGLFMKINTRALSPFNS